MSITLLLFAGGLFVLAACLTGLAFRYRIAKIFAAIALIAIAGFCGFGFLASNELSDTAERIPWQVGYGAIGGAALLGSALIIARLRLSSGNRRD